MELALTGLDHNKAVFGGLDITGAQVAMSTRRWRESGRPMFVAVAGGAEHGAEHKPLPAAVNICERLMEEGVIGEDSGLYAQDIIDRVLCVGVEATAPRTLDGVVALLHSEGSVVRGDETYARDIIARALAIMGFASLIGDHGCEQADLAGKEAVVD